MSDGGLQGVCCLTKLFRQRRPVAGIVEAAADKGLGRDSGYTGKEVPAVARAVGTGVAE